MYIYDDLIRSFLVMNHNGGLVLMITNDYPVLVRNEFVTELFKNYTVQGYSGS